MDAELTKQDLLDALAATDNALHQIRNPLQRTERVTPCVGIDAPGGKDTRVETYDTAIMALVMSECAIDAPYVQERRAVAHA